MSCANKSKQRRERSSAGTCKLPNDGRLRQAMAALETTQSTRSSPTTAENIPTGLRSLAGVVRRPYRGPPSLFSGREFSGLCMPHLESQILPPRGVYTRCFSLSFSPRFRLPRLVSVPARPDLSERSLATSSSHYDYNILCLLVRSAARIRARAPPRRPPRPCRRRA